MCFPNSIDSSNQVNTQKSIEDIHKKVHPCWGVIPNLVEFKNSREQALKKSFMESMIRYEIAW